MSYSSSYCYSEYEACIREIKILNDDIAELQKMYTIVGDVMTYTEFAITKACSARETVRAFWDGMTAIEVDEKITDYWRNAENAYNSADEFQTDIDFEMLKLTKAIDQEEYEKNLWYNRYLDALAEERAAASAEEAEETSE